MSEAQPELVEHEGWWLVLAKNGEKWVCTTTDAPTEEEAERLGMQVLAMKEGTGDLDYQYARGPFPNQVSDGEVDARPNQCAGCGLVTWCGNHPPVPNQTWFEEDDEHSTGDESRCWACLGCGTLTHLPIEGSDA